MRRFSRLAAWVAVVTAALGTAAPASANHSVFVEGNCLGPGIVPRVIVPPGTCGDYDGDGRIGVAEDNDEPDRVFGTINAALGPGAGAGVGTGANQNGTVTIVTDGVFPEVVTITAANGNVTLQAVPGVEADINAVVQGIPGNVGRQALPGIIVNAPRDRYVVIRNVVSRNWTSGVQILGDSRVALDRVRAENNVNFGIEVRDHARVTITGAEVHATGHRVGAGAGDFPRTDAPQPGTGIEFLDTSAGQIMSTTVSGSFAVGIADDSRELVCVSHVNVFDNERNFDNVRHGEGDCENNRQASASFAPPAVPAWLLAVFVGAALFGGSRRLASRRMPFARDAG